VQSYQKSYLYKPEVTVIVEEFFRATYINTERCKLQRALVPKPVVLWGQLDEDAAAGRMTWQHQQSSCCRTVYGDSDWQDQNGLCTMRGLPQSYKSMSAVASESAQVLVVGEPSWPGKPS